MRFLSTFDFYSTTSHTHSIMASVALNTLRTSRQPIQRLAASLVGPSSFFSLSSSPLASTSTTSAEPSTSSVSFSLPLSAPQAAPTSPLASLASLIPDSLSAGLRDLLPPWVFAVPKRRTTHSAKRMRSANKHLKEKQSESHFFLFLSLSTLG